METKQEDKKICRALLNVAPAESDYDFECVAVPVENGQTRYNYNKDEYFVQILGAKPENIERSRLDSGIPLFDNHPYDTSALNTLGISVSYSFDDRGLVIRCKFGARADEALRSDIANGIIKTVSIEGSILTYSITRNAGELPKYFAELWQPESISFAPIPQDIDSQIEVKRKIQNQLKGIETNKSIINQLKTKF